MGGRGPASIIQIYDEVAQWIATGSSGRPEEVFNSATPALRQFGSWSMCCLGSSPWTQLGVFFERARRGLAIDPVTHAPRYPNIFMVQLPSWDIYEGWKDTQ